MRNLLRTQNRFSQLKIIEKIINVMYGKRKNKKNEKDLILVKFIIFKNS
jgi:hypothetical protein